MSKKNVVDINNLTMRQMREVSQALGGTPDEWKNDPFGLQAAIAWQTKKANGDTEFTFDQALDLSAQEIADLFGIELPQGADVVPLEQ